MSEPITSTPPSQRIKALLSFKGRYRILHLTWFAFFLSFVVWFNFAPFSATIGEELGLSREQLITIGLCKRRIDRARPCADRHGVGPLGTPTGLRHDPDLCRGALHPVRHCYQL